MTKRTSSPLSCRVCLAAALAALAAAALPRSLASPYAGLGRRHDIVDGGAGVALRQKLVDDPAGNLAPRELTPNVAGGQPVPSATAFPFVARVVYPENVGNYNCTATLVAPRAALTSSNCVSPYGYLPDAVEVGRFNLSLTPQDDGAYVFTVRSFEPIGYDMMLLGLSEPVVVGSRPLVPAVLSTTDPAVGAAVKAAGWGMGADGKFVSQLAEVDLAVSYVSGNEIWTANPSKGTCSGDEGGPLVLDVAGNKTVVGMSLYHSCGSTTDTRSLFVRLSQYADAIASAVDLVTGRRTRTTTSTQTTATMTRRTMTVNPAVKRICKTSAVPIPEYGKASFNLPVSGVGSIGSVAVELDLTHSYMSDLEISIRHPAGGTVALFQHSVSCGHASGRPNSYPPLFFDDSTDPDMYCNYGYDPSMGPELYKPVGELSRFKGLVANGTWNLLVNDTAQGDEGTIRSVCLHILPVQSSKTVTVTVSRCTKSVTRTLVSSKCTKTSTLSKCTKTVQRTTSRWTTRTVTLKTATRTRVVTRTITATVKTT